MYAMRHLNANEVIRAVTIFQKDRTFILCSNCTKQVERERERERGLRARRPVRTPRLTPAHRAARRQFAQLHMSWQLEHLKSVLFTDESRYRLTRCDGLCVCRDALMSVTCEMLSWKFNFWRRICAIVGWHQH